jgi:hypothetical protein
MSEAERRMGKRVPAHKREPYAHSTTDATHSNVIYKRAKKKQIKQIKQKSGDEGEIKMTSG